MTKEQAAKYSLCFIAIWLLGSLVTYGHVLKQFKAEDAAACERQWPNQNVVCPSSARVVAFMVSCAAWPYVWSEEAWK